MKGISHSFNYFRTCSTCGLAGNRQKFWAKTEHDVLFELANAISTYNGYGEKDEWSYVDPGIWFCPNCHTGAE